MCPRHWLRVGCGRRIGTNDTPMPRLARVILVSVGSLAMTVVASAWTGHEPHRRSELTRPQQVPDLFQTREAVWHAWFAGDTLQLGRLLPDSVVAIENGAEWHDRRGVLRGSANFAASGGRLISLEFPKTVVQRFGDVAIVYSTYRLILEQGGQRDSLHGRATEVFTLRGGHWLNPSWHMDSGS
jgi:ketosteroid isomerase-like protein